MIDRVVEHLREAAAELRTNELRAYWLATSGNRQDVQRELLAALSDEPILPLIVRGVRFDNPNDLMADVLRLIEIDSRAASEALRDCGILVLLGRVRLTVPQLSSPMCLPEWFPFSAGQEVLVPLVDFSSLQGVALDSEAAAPARVAGALLELEVALALALQRSGNRARPLLDRLARDGESPLDLPLQALGVADAARRTGSFRPSYGKVSIVDRIFHLSAQTPADSLRPVLSLLADALGLPDSAPMCYESVLAVLWRPPAPEPGRRRIARNLVATVSGSCRYLTASHHAGEYGLFDADLLSGLSNDLAAACEGLVELIDGT